VDLSEVKQFTKMDAASMLMLRAADIMEHKGLCKGDLTNERGQVCTLQAFLEADGRKVQWAEWGTRRTLAKALQRFMRAIGVNAGCASNICGWSNRQKDATTVAAKLRAVALGL
jgi:hypothetical protein